MTNIAWLYDKDHSLNPFFGLAIHSLVKEGFGVTIIDRACHHIDDAYKHIRLGVKTAFLWKRVRIKGYGILMRWLSLFSMLFRVLREKPSIIITSLPTDGMVGWMAKILLKTRLVYYPFELYGEQDQRVWTFWRKCEAWLLSRGADSVITQNDYRAQIYVNERKARVSPAVVHNYKQKRSAGHSGRLRELLNLSEDSRIVLYEGQLQRGRLLDKLLEATLYFPEKTILVLMGEAMPWWKNNASELLSLPKIAAHTFIAPYVPHKEVLEYIADADVGVIIYDGNIRNNYFCEPGKLSDYVFAGVPVAVPDFPTIAPVVRKYGIGAVFERPLPREIAGAVRFILSHPRQAWSPALEKAAEELTWESQEPGFLKAVSGRG